MKEILRNNLQSAGPHNPPTVDFHPYRFVFIDACSSGKGDLCLCFGIPEVQTTVDNMQNNLGIRPRAFVGWKKRMWYKAGAFNQAHAQYITQFFEYWANETDPNTKGPYTLVRALQAVDWLGYYEDLQIWGATNLLFSQ